MLLISSSVYGRNNDFKFNNGGELLSSVLLFHLESTIKVLVSSFRFISLPTAIRNISTFTVRWSTSGDPRALRVKWDNLAGKGLKPKTLSSGQILPVVIQKNISYLINNPRTLNFAGPPFATLTQHCLPRVYLWFFMNATMMLKGLIKLE